MAKTKKTEKLPKGIRLHRSGLYEWRFMTEGITYSGYGKTLKEAEKSLADKKYEVSHGMYHKEKNISVDAWFKIWMGTYKVNCKDSTRYEYDKNFRLYISPVIGKKKMKDIRTVHIQKLLNGFKGKYAKSTIGNCNIVLYGMFDRAVKSGVININPVINSDRPKAKPSQKKGAVSSEIQKAFLRYAVSSPYYRLYKAASLTGMRINELLGLSTEDIDTKNAVIHVCHSLDYIPFKGFKLDTPKTICSFRDIPLLPETKALFHSERVAQCEDRLKFGQYWKPLEGMERLVFTTRYGTPHYASNVNKDMRDILLRMKKDGYDIPNGFSFHSLRHCFATRCIEGGMGMKTLQKILGHSTLAMTMDTYADVLPSTVASEMEKIASNL